MQSGMCENRLLESTNAFCRWRDHEDVLFVPAHVYLLDQIITGFH